MNVPLIWTWLYWCWVGGEIVLAIFKRAPSDADTRDRGSQIILWAVIFPAVTVCEFIRHLWPPNIPIGAALLDSISLAILIIGLVIRTVAIISLGKSFTTNVAIRASQKVHQTGLYGIVRHPSYLGLLLVFVAFGLHSKNYIGLAVAVIPTTAAILYRIHIEELALVKAFGDDYRMYSRRTKRLLPGVF